MAFLSNAAWRLSLISVFLFACGGAPNENPNYLAANGLGRSVTVTVSGASGGVTVMVGTRTLTFSGDGSQEVAGLPPSGDITAEITASPEGQDCFFSPSNLTSIVVSTRADVVCSVPGIRGSVKNFFTGDGVVGASVTAYEVVGGVASSFSTTTVDDDGNYEITGTTAGNRYSLAVTASGFAPQTVVALPTSSRPSVVENVLMVPENVIDTEDPTGDMTFTVEGIDVLQVPANSLVDAENNAPVGNVTASITLLDPSSGTSALPGRYEFDSGSSTNFVESFGGISIVLTDAEGTALELVDGASADVTIPVATKAISVSPSSASVYLFSAMTGVWEEAVSASLSTVGATPVYEATVSELPYVFTSGQVYSTVEIQGCIEDSGGNPVIGATIVVQGSDYIGTSYAISGSDGTFSVEAKAESEVFVFGLIGARSRTQSVTTETSTATLGSCLLFDTESTAITLTWGETPSDLDSHLYGPAEESGDSRFHVYYSLRSVTVGDVTMFLDVDDVSGFGPEVTTVPSFPVAGRYEFFVDNFSGTADIQSSPARVEVNMRGENFTFSPPVGTPTRCWHVFDISVDSALRGTMIEVNEWEGDRSICTSTGLNPSGVTLEPSVLPAGSPASRAIQGKYYAR